MISKEKRALWGLSIGHFFLDMYAAILIPLYPLIAAKLNINLIQISTVIGVGYGISAAMQPFFGYISDKLTKRIFMVLGLVFAALFMPLGFIAQNSLILTLFLILGMAGNAFYHPQTTIMIKEFYNDNLALSKAMGLFLGLGTVGYSVGPYLSSYIIKNFNNDKFIYIGTIGIFFAFAMLFFVPKVKQKTIKHNDSFLSAFVSIFKNKICLYLTVITVIKSALIMSYATYIPFLLKKSGFSITSTGIIMSIFFIVSGFSMIFASKIENVYKLKGIIAISYIPILPLTLIFLYLLKYSKTAATIVFLSIGLFILLAAGCVLAHAQKEIPAHSGIVSGIIQGFTLSLGSLLLIPFGIIGERFGAEYVLILIGLTAFIAAVFTIKTKILDNN